MGCSASQDEQCACGAIGQRGPWALPPVPSTASYTCIVAPYNFSFLWVLLDSLSTGYSLEVLPASGKDQSRRTVILVQVPPPEWNLVLDGNSIVNIGQSIRRRASPTSLP